MNKRLNKNEELSAKGGRLSPVSGMIPLLSKMLLPVSQIPPITICRFWGIMPSWRWGAAIVPATRRREVRPIDIGLRGIFTWPKTLTETVLEQVKKQAEYERDVESGLKEKLLEVEMCYESGEISEEEYRKKEAELKKKLEAIKK